MTTRSSKHETYIIIYLIVFTVALRLLTLMMIHTGIDERDYWISAKNIVLNLPYGDLSHRTVRFAIIIPTALTQYIFGVNPRVYYLMPLLLSCAQVPLLYNLIRKHRGINTAIFAVALLIFFPYMIRAGSQQRPAIYSITYMLAALTLFDRYMNKSDSDRLAPLIGTAVFIFIAYLTKVTNLFFVPGFLVVLFFLKAKPKDGIIFIVVLAGLLAFETILYGLFAGEVLGHLGIITGSHLAAEELNQQRMSFLGLFRRYHPDKFPFYWTVYLIAALAAVSFYVRKKATNIKRAYSIFTISFLVGMTFQVKSLSPLIPAEPFISRYFCAALSTMIPLISFGAADIVLRFAPKPVAKRGHSFYGVVILVLLIGMIAIFSSGKLPSRLDRYYNNPLKPSRHPIHLVDAYRNEITAYLGSGQPLVADPENAGRNSLSTATHFFLEERYYEDGKPPEIMKRSVDNSEIAYLLLRDWRSQADTLFSNPGRIIKAARRSPFRIEKYRIGELSSISLWDDL